MRGVEYRKCAGEIAAQDERAHLEDIAGNAPQTLPSYVALARATLARAVTDGRLVPLRAARIRDLLDDAAAGRILREVR